MSIVDLFYKRAQAGGPELFWLRQQLELLNDAEDEFNATLSIDERKANRNFDKFYKRFSDDVISTFFIGKNQIEELFDCFSMLEESAIPGRSEQYVKLLLDGLGPREAFKLTYQKGDDPEWDRMNMLADRAKEYTEKRDQRIMDKAMDLMGGLGEVNYEDSDEFDVENN